MGYEIIPYVLNMRDEVADNPRITDWMRVYISLPDVCLERFLYVLPLPPTAPWFKRYRRKMDAWYQRKYLFMKGE